MTGAILPKTIGCVLAGGLSRRMGGGDKALKALGGKPMLAHVIERLRPQVSAMVLNANGDPARFEDFGLPVAPDPIEGFAGPLAGVLAGLRWAETNAPHARWVASAAADTPFFPSDLVERLGKAADQPQPTIALAASGGHRHPVFGLWPVALADDLEHFLRTESTRKVLAWVSRHANVEVAFEPTHVNGATLDPFFNANTPDDMAQAAGYVAEPQA
ncbi:molybdenum cofactor guanylyltransferase MobA [Breoghania sp. L-A4]|uniref:molybdenum cofactor guanylyltransferase MobA n=1 Tax=Breoghania sp. L-A4 TaxID=2304600 RepID=UPI000E35976F|nr:molybdenum cofactor guanylyltransferase MobA [Breoghania sp. L-A4]AXS40122.1 molybdenum cofactor guanylyltransferase MobA [Breoghania sp. L-A4]